jgi:hypothetical protein
VSSISLQSFCSAPARDQRTGLLGWITIRVGPFVAEGIALRRTRDGRLALSYPARTDAKGRRHPVFWPTDDASRVLVETNILKQLGLEPGKPVSG